MENRFARKKKGFARRRGGEGMSRQGGKLPECATCDNVKEHNLFIKSKTHKRRKVCNTLEMQKKHWTGF